MWKDAGRAGAGGVLTATWTRQALCRGAKTNRARERASWKAAASPRQSHSPHNTAARTWAKGDENGRTILHWAYASGKEKLIALCLELEADENVKDNSGVIPSDHKRSVKKWQSVNTSGNFK